MKVETQLEIVATGAVSPGGLGAEPLLAEAPWPSTPMPLLYSPGLAVDCAPIGTDIPMPRHRRLRRTGRISRFMVAAAEDAVSRLDEPLNTKRLGVVCALSLGGIEYCHRFFQQVVKDGQHYASPILFPDTVFNSPASHMAACLELEGPSYSLIGDESVWVQAMLTAHTWLTVGTVDQVLVVAATELESVSLDGLTTIGWWNGSNRTFRPTEGAAAMILQAPCGKGPRIESLQLGFDYGSPQALRKLLPEIRDELPADARYLDTGRDSWTAAMEKKCLSGFERAEANVLPSLGGAWSASSAWYTLRLLETMETGHRYFQPTWGTMSSYGGLALRKG